VHHNRKSIPAGRYLISKEVPVKGLITLLAVGGLAAMAVLTPAAMFLDIGW
jgi:hypothetical protein